MLDCSSYIFGKGRTSSAMCLTKELWRLLKTSGDPVEEVPCKCKTIFKNFHNVAEIRSVLKEMFSPIVEDVIVSGPFENRLIIFRVNDGRFIFLTPRSSIRDNPYIVKNSSDLDIFHPDRNLSLGYIPCALLNRLVKPHIKFVALYHPENFPLPRFALGISDMARSIREEYLGFVTLSDMQLGKTADDIYKEITTERPEIIAISATFGQQDVLERLLNLIASIKDYLPLVVFGGSLSALNCERLISTYPSSIVGLGPGESIIIDIVRYWLGEIEIHEIGSVMILLDGKPFKTLKNKQPPDTAGIPELDLLDKTLECRGVMQLESTRGCSYACSFCPRSHKGIWIPQSINLIERLLPEISDIYDRHPNIARKIFLVDEEFVGYKEDEITAKRIFGVCDTLKKYNFTFETSARVDQVYRKNRDKEWHVQRIGLWRYLVEKGLDRVLFGVESGVDSILERFNKKTCRLQNEQAIRILSAYDIPVRLTYITFDPLMSLEELLESFKFQGRKDLLLKSALHLSPGELFDAIHDGEYISELTANQPLYREISYLLVSLECLIGSKYLSKVEERGLAQQYNYSMGRREAEYLDPRIGLLSYNAQLWVDRNFSLDYTVKSIEKITHKETRHLIRDLRTVIKDYAYGLLAKFLAVITGDLSLIQIDLVKNVGSLKRISARWDNSMIDVKKNQYLLREIMDEHFEYMKQDFEKSYANIIGYIGEIDREKMGNIIDSWKTKKEWHLINPVRP